MFEKEAEEYFRENAYNFDELTACRECMEFGYNKAKGEVKAPYPSYKHLFGESIEQTALRHSNDLINSLRVDIDHAKTIIQDLLNNSDEYARQRAMDFLKED